MIGKTINNYIIERKLGEGGMGNVYFARHNRVDRLVAIKVLHQNLFTNENIRNRFKNEANALIKLGHPNIVKIYDYVEQDNFACLVMEYIEGYTLDDYITKVSGPLVTEKAIHIICNILDAVQYAHDNNILHRDIKPGNIMVSKDGRIVRIMDFGIAKIVDAENFKATKANTQLGTPFYMSPEQVKGLPYTGLSDIYSLGVTLFEMVTGKCPYQTITNLFELQSKIVNEPLPPTAIYYPEVSPIIQASIKKATEKDPALRFHSCNEFKIYLQKDKAEPLLPSVPVAIEMKTRKTVTQPAVTTKKITVNGDKPAEKKISYPNLLEAYPQNEKQKKTWVYGLMLFLMLFISGLIYFLNKNTENYLVNKKSENDKTSDNRINGPGIIDSSYNSTQFPENDVQTVKNEKGNPSMYTKDTDTAKNIIPGSTVTVEPNSISLATKEKKSVTDPPFRYFNESEINRFLAGKLNCNGEIYNGQNQRIKYDNFPKISELKKMKFDETVTLYFTFIGKTPGNTGNYQVICTKKENDFEKANPIIVN